MADSESLARVYVTIIAPIYTFLHRGAAAPQIDERLGTRDGPARQASGRRGRAMWKCRRLMCRWKKEAQPVIRRNVLSSGATSKKVFEYCSLAYATAAGGRSHGRSRQRRLYGDPGQDQGVEARSRRLELSRRGPAACLACRLLQVVGPGWTPRRRRVGIEGGGRTRHVQVEC